MIDTIWNKNVVRENCGVFKNKIIFELGFKKNWNLPREEAYHLHRVFCGAGEGGVFVEAAGVWFNFPMHIRKSNEKSV